MKLDLGKGTAHAARTVNAIIWAAITLAVLAIGVRWLAHFLDSYLVAFALGGLALVSFASFLSDGGQPHAAPLSSNDPQHRSRPHRAHR